MVEDTSSDLGKVGAPIPAALDGGIPNPPFVADGCPLLTA
jgi:hypothetical protein